MTLLYIAGHYTGRTPWETEQNIRRAEEVSVRLWRVGIPNICPHSMTRFMVGVAPYETFMEGDLEILSRCDGIVLLDNWQASRGAVREHDAAVTMRIEIHNADDYLREVGA